MTTPLKRPALGRGLTSLMSQMAPEDAAQREPGPEPGPAAHPL